jgi:hypothetical protein
MQTNPQPLTYHEALNKINTVYFTALELLGEMYKAESKAEYPDTKLEIVYNTAMQKARLQYNTAIEKLNRLNPNIYNAN